MLLLRLCCYLSLSLLTACAIEYDELAEKRSNYAHEKETDIVVAIIKDERDEGYTKGIELAAKEINERPEKLLGRNLRLEYKTGSDDFDTVRPTIRNIASDPEIVAVLGHNSSSVAVPASLMYEKSQTVFLPPTSTIKALTRHGFQYVFRMFPSSLIMSKQSASVASILGYNKMVLLYERAEIWRELAFLFENESVEKQIRFVHHSSFFAHNENYRPLISEFKNLKFDAVFLSAPAEAGARMARQLREMGVDVPLMGSDGLVSTKYTEAAGSAANNTIIPTIYSAQQKDQLNTLFVKRYEEAYDEEPTIYAAQGYDSLKLLTYGIDTSQSTVPSVLTAALHFLPYWDGVTGIHAFTKYGELKGKKYYFQVYQDKQWKRLPAIHLPYLLEQFQIQVKRKRGYGSKVTDFNQALNGQLHIDDYKRVLIDMLHELLEFKSLGVIYENTKAGKITADYKILNEVAIQKDFTVIDCEIPFSQLEEEEVKKRLVDCYGKVATYVDILYLTPYPKVDKGFIKELNDSLKFYNIPSVVIDHPDLREEATISLEKFGVDFNDPQIMRLYDSILGDTKVHQFQGKLQNLPRIEANLKLYLETRANIDNMLLLSPYSYYAAVYKDPPSGSD